MQLSQREEALLTAVRRLPADTVEQLCGLTERLAALASAGAIDWSDSWSEADLRDYSAASLERLEQEYPEGRS